MYISKQLYTEIFIKGFGWTVYMTVLWCGSQDDTRFRSIAATKSGFYWESMPWLLDCWVSPFAAAVASRSTETGWR